MQPAITNTGSLDGLGNTMDSLAKAVGSAVKGRPGEAANPYLAARSAWDERYGDQIARAKNWRLAAFICAAVALLAVGGLIMMARQSRLVPFVVAVNELGRPVASGLASSAPALPEQVMKAAMADFVSEWRAVTLDWAFQRRSIDNVFARIAQGSRAQTSISEWYRADPPQNRAQKGTTEIEIKAVLPTGPKTWEVDWTEIKRLATGQLQTKENFKGLLTVAINPPQGEADVRGNPLGIFIVDATWSPVY